MSIPQKCKGKELIASWTYYAMDGDPLGVVVRYENDTGKKDIVPFFKGNQDNWQTGIELNPRPLYGQEKLTSHDKNRGCIYCRG